MARKKEKEYIIGIYEDDEVLLEGIKKLRAHQYKIANVYTPFPVHGLDEALGLKESRLPVVSFLFGLTGASFALWMQWYMYTHDWPLNVGGKPHFPLPTFVPITFELMVLLAALGMVFFYLLRNWTFPGIFKKPIDPRQTDDRFVVVIKPPESPEQRAQLESLLQESGAVETKTEYLRL